MIVKNEERCIRKSLEAALPFVDDVIVVDTGSTDRTLEILNEYQKHQDAVAPVSVRPHHIYIEHFQWVDDFSKARNYSLEISEQHGADVNLVLDADEYLQTVPGGYAKLREQVADFNKKYGDDWKGTLVRIDQFENEKKEIDSARTRTDRLLPRGIRYRGSIHEQTSPTGHSVPCLLVADHDGYLQKGKGNRNLTYLINALDKDPDNPYYNAQAGITFHNLGLPEEALPYLEKFLYFWEDRVFSKPKEENAVLPDYVYLGVLAYLYCLTDLNTEETLETAMQTAVRIQPWFDNITDFWFFCGILYMDRLLINTKKYIDELPMIEQCYMICLELGENSFPLSVAGTGSYKAAYNLGTWYESSGQKDKAVSCYQMAADLGYEPASKRLKELQQTDK